MEKQNKKIELLAPVGNFERLIMAINYGADAVYLAGLNYGLRAFSDNFNNDELAKAVILAHKNGVRVYVTLNIFAYDEDFIGLDDYIRYLVSIGVDAVIVSDAGIIALVKKVAPTLEIHLSTQANTTNSYSAAFWAEMGVKRIVLARELSLERIAAIRDKLDDSVELEAFVHGAMCMSYSGRCLLSNYLANRPSNHGECAQSCRWEYSLVEKSRGEEMPIMEDARGSYILNSKDMNMIARLDKLAACGITSFKIEGRIKSAYYVASVVNAYRRALDIYCGDRANYVCPQILEDELAKTSHRLFCTGFYFGEAQQCLETSKPRQDWEMVAIVSGVCDGGYIIEQRNRFAAGEEVEVLSPNSLGQKLIIPPLTDEKGNIITDALRVQQKLFIKTDIKLAVNDIFRKISTRK